MRFIPLQKTGIITQDSLIQVSDQLGEYLTQRWEHSYTSLREETEICGKI